MDSVKEWWSSYQVVGSPDFILTQKLRNLKKDISCWNNEVFGKLETQKSKALNELTIMEQSCEGRVQTQAEKAQMINMQSQIQQLAKIEEVSWRQKSRCLWLKEGYRNTRYFQTMANSHRRYNSIDKLKIDNKITEDKEVINEEILNYYQNLYKESEEWRPTASFEEVARLTGSC